MTKRTVFTALVFVAGNLLAQGNTSRLSRPIEYWSPDWSPDGETLVFESTLSGKYSVFTIGADGSGLTQLTRDTANNEQPRWSPDGRRIVFSSDRAGHLDLYLMNADGSAQTRLTTTQGGGYYQSSFSPDGKWILFQGRPSNAEVRDHVYLVAPDGSGFRQLTDSSYAAEGPRWSRDGKSFTFARVPYHKRLWAEMTPADMDAAKAATTTVAMHLDGTAAPVPQAARPQIDPAVMDKEAVLSPDGKRFAYTKSVDGWMGLYVYDVASRTERRITGGPGAGPLGYLRTAVLPIWNDTLDTYTSPRDQGPLVRGNGAWLIRTARQIGARRWDIADTWFDSTGHQTARQSVRTAPGSLATQVEWVRADQDSATLFAGPDHVTGWVVPAGQGPQLFDGASTGERYDGTIVRAAIALSHTTPGAVFVAPVGTLYGGNPLGTRVDTISVLRRDTLYRGNQPIPVVVLGRSGGGESWMDESSGDEVLARGSAGPDRWWWHVRRGVTPPRR